ncbi:hypothetical protein GE061_005387 [Apolygus lucorum]|uniref:Alpha-carbonic anhydrase domain-containing protein n=1 Tax=Apolygus lucorum TaxID=248454 RepID=A0A8S9WVH2_APOLU|nr:hypothetical protein GE061_005387 [Apolygus lucorum]
MVNFEYERGFGSLSPCQWSGVYPSCGGSHQSPIDLPVCATEVCQNPLKFTNLMREPEQIELVHMLHTPLIKYHMLDPIRVRGGPLCGGYIFDHYNIRWGADSKMGSEHTLGGRGYAGEVQLVFHKDTTSGFHEAINITDGVVIFSVWLEEIPRPDNINFEEIIAMLDYVTRPWSYTDLCQHIPIMYYLPADRQHYYTYKGSLTYPPCPETVIWVIFQETMPISHYQLLKFRRMIGVKGPITTNVRPRQSSKTQVWKVHTPPGCMWDRKSTMWYVFFEVLSLSLSASASSSYIHRVDFEYQSGFGNLEPCQWSSVYPSCEGSNQSPIDLPPCAQEICQRPLRFSNLLGEPEQVELIHMLHTPLVKYHMLEPISVSGGPLCGSYIFDHYNVRWGSDTQHGSEHTLGGKGFAGEVQLVFYKNTTNGFHEAINMTDGVVIFSVWLEEVRTPDNSYFDEMLGMLDYITKPWSYTDLCEKIPIKYYLPEDRQRYYTYKGSLTYPPCPETVIWVVFLETLPFSNYQLLKCRRMIGVKGPISKNVRPVQGGNSRNVVKVHTPPSCIGE